MMTPSHYNSLQLFAGTIIYSVNIQLNSHSATHAIHVHGLVTVSLIPGNTLFVHVYLIMNPQLADHCVSL